METQPKTFDDKARALLVSQARWAKEVGAPVDVQPALDEIDRLREYLVEISNSPKDSTEGASPVFLLGSGERIRLAKLMLKVGLNGVKVKAQKDGAFIVSVFGLPVGRLQHEFEIEGFIRNITEYYL